MKVAFKTVSKDSKLLLSDAEGKSQVSLKRIRNVIMFKCVVQGNHSRVQWAYWRPSGDLQERGGGMVR